MKPWGVMRRFGVQDSAHPDFAKVALLLHFDGADGSTTFTDSSSYARAGTVSGGAKLSTSGKIVGLSSGLFAGSSDYVYYPHSAVDDIGTGAFCIECDVKLTSLTGYVPLLGKGAYAVFASEWTLFVVDGLYLDFYYGQRGTNQAHIQFLLPAGLATGAAYKLCVRRDAAGNWGGYLGGVKCLQYRFSPLSAGVSFGAWNGGELNNKVSLSPGNNLWVARHPALGVSGRLDELRFTVGDGIYTGDYTPQPGPFPDS